MCHTCANLQAVVTGGTANEEVTVCVGNFGDGVHIVGGEEGETEGGTGL